MAHFCKRDLQNLYNLFLIVISIGLFLLCKGKAMKAQQGAGKKELTAAFLDFFKIKVFRKFFLLFLDFVFSIKCF